MSQILTITFSSNFLPRLPLISVLLSSFSYSVFSSLLASSKLLMFYLGDSFLPEPGAAFSFFFSLPISKSISSISLLTSAFEFLSSLLPRSAED
jgi:hypothetical protein